MKIHFFVLHEYCSLFDSDAFLIKCLQIALNNVYSWLGVPRSTLIGCNPVKKKFLFLASMLFLAHSKIFKDIFLCNAFPFIKL